MKLYQAETLELGVVVYLLTRHFWVSYMDSLCLHVLIHRTEIVAGPPRVGDNSINQCPRSAQSNLVNEYLIKGGYSGSHLLQYSFLCRCPALSNIL